MNSKIRKLRKCLNLSQADLAQKADISRYTLHKLETGKNKGYLTSTIQQVAKVLNVPVCDIFF